MINFNNMTTAELKEVINDAPHLNHMNTTNMAVHLAKMAQDEIDRRSKNKEHGAKMSPFERSILELTLSGDLESRYRRLTKEEGTMHCDSSLGGDAPEWCRRTIKPGERIANFYEDYSSWTEEQKRKGVGGSWDMAPNCLDCEVRDIAEQFKA
jgi:hypothetical protein